jgi:hypothetical protein
MEGNTRDRWDVFFVSFNSGFRGVVGSLADLAPQSGLGILSRRIYRTASAAFAGPARYGTVKGQQLCHTLRKNQPFGGEIMSLFKKLFLIVSAGMLSLSLAACEPADRTAEPARQPTQPAQPAQPGQPTDQTAPAQPGQPGQPANGQTAPGGR